MKRYKKVLVASFFLFLTILLSWSFIFFQRLQSDRFIQLSDMVIHEFRGALSGEMTSLLSFSLALAENGELKEALKHDDEKAGYLILQDIIERFRKHTHIDTLRIQVLTPEFYIFARSWDEGFEGMPVWWFRDDLETLRNNKQPKVGMETGRLLTFKSTIPIRSQKRLLGYLEVIELIDEFSERLRSNGIELFALMDEKYLEKASLMRDFPRIFGKVIANRNYNTLLKLTLEKVNIEMLNQKQYMKVGEYLLLWEPMYNGSGDHIGDYLLVLSQESYNRFQSKENAFSLLRPFSDEDIKRAVALREERYGSFRSGYDRDLVGLLSKLHEEDKVELEAEAREILMQYDKSELIDVIIDNKHREKKIGVIE